MLKKDVAIYCRVDNKSEFEIERQKEVLKKHCESNGYEIFKIYSIDPDDVSCVESVENNTREITLITCTNGHKNRLVTKAREVL